MAPGRGGRGHGPVWPAQLSAIGAEFRGEALCRGTQRVVGQMGISLGRAWARMAQQPADNLKAEAVRNKMRRIGVAIVVAAVVGDVRFPDRCAQNVLMSVRCSPGTLPAVFLWACGIEQL